MILLGLFFSVTNQERSVCDKIKNTEVPLLGPWESAKKIFFKSWMLFSDFGRKMLVHGFTINQGKKAQCFPVNRGATSVKGLTDHFRPSLMSQSTRLPSMFCLVKPETLASDFYPGKNTSNSNVTELFWATQLIPFPSIMDTQNTVLSFQIPIPYWNHTEVEQNPPYTWSHPRVVNLLITHSILIYLHDHLSWHHRA